MSSGDPNTRLRIMEETRRLLEERDDQTVRLKDIAQAAGVSRQAIYMHFGSRVGLLVATVQYVDESQKFFERTRTICDEENGIKALTLFVEFWSDYVLEIYNLAKGLLASRSTDPAAAAAWSDRMEGLRRICGFLINRLKEDNQLKEEWQVEEAADLLWTLISVQAWENLSIERGWSKEQYKGNLLKVLWGTFVSNPPP